MEKFIRAMVANNAAKLLKAEPSFFWKDGRLWLRWRSSGAERTCRVVISKDTDFMVNHHRQPWGGNQGQALSVLAQWIRTGEMRVSRESWIAWCGHPVWLGGRDGIFLGALLNNLFGEPSRHAGVVRGAKSGSEPHVYGSAEADACLGGIRLTSEKSMKSTDSDGDNGANGTQKRQYGTRIGTRGGAQ